MAPFKVLDAAVAKQPYLLGNDFTVADLNVAAVISRAIEMDLSAVPNLKAWLTRCLDRPAARAALALKTKADNETPVGCDPADRPDQSPVTTTPGPFNPGRAIQRGAGAAPAGPARRSREALHARAEGAARPLRRAASARYCSTTSAARPARRYRLIAAALKVQPRSRRRVVEPRAGAARAQAQRRGAGAARQGAWRSRPATSRRSTTAATCCSISNGRPTRSRRSTPCWRRRRVISRR